MEYIDEEVGLRSEEEIITASGGVLMSLADYSEESSLYSRHLLANVTQDEFYVLTKDGKAYLGDSVMCAKTRTKDLIKKDTIRLCYNEDTNTLQFIAFFKDGTSIDARGHYAQNNLKILRRKRKVIKK